MLSIFAIVLAFAVRNTPVVLQPAIPVQVTSQVQEVSPRWEYQTTVNPQKTANGTYNYNGNLTVEPSLITGQLHEGLEVR